MIFRNARLEDLKLMCELWNEVVTEEYFLKTMSVDAYEEKLLNNPDFSYDSTFVVYDEENTLIAFAIGYLRKQYIDNLEVAGIVNAIIVKKEYRRQGIGSKLLTKLETYFKQPIFFPLVMLGIFRILIIMITLVHLGLELILMNTSFIYIGVMNLIIIKMLFI